MYLLSKVNTFVAESVLHIGSFTAEYYLVGGPSLHLAGCHTLSGYVCIAIESVLHLLGLSREQCAVERKDIEYLQQNHQSLCMQLIREVHHYLLYPDKLERIID